MNPLEVTVFKKVTIADSASLSGALVVQGYDVVALQQPANTEGTTFSFQGSLDGTVFADVYDASGGEVKVTKSATLAQVLMMGVAKIDGTVQPVPLKGLNAIKVRTGLTGGATNQTGAVDIWVGLVAAAP